MKKQKESKKITKELRDKFRELANAMPPVYDNVAVYRGFQGSQLIADGIKEVERMRLDEKGQKEKYMKPVSPKKVYEIQVASQVPVNHFKKLCKLYKKGFDRGGIEAGMECVLKWCKVTEYVNTLDATALIDYDKNKF